MPFKEGNGASGQQGIVPCRGAVVKGARPGDKTCINPALRAPTSGTVSGAIGASCWEAARNLRRGGTQVGF